MSTDALVIEYSPVGKNGRVALTVRYEGEVLALDKLDLLTASARERFAEKLCGKASGIDRTDLDGQLLQIAEEVKRLRSGPTEDYSTDELDVSCIVRPERFITPEVSGLSIATPTLCNGKPAGRWRLYLRWADGKREAIDLPDSLALPDQRTLWLHPTPGESNLRQTPGWTQSARKAWLAGAEVPEPADVFKRLCQCVAHYIDFPQERAAGTTATLALWVMLTYCYPAWPAIPYLYLGGPAASGKSRVFEVLSRLVFRPLQSSNMTGPALFRTLHGRGGTLLYDEAERLKQSTPDVGEINSMLLAGYKRGGRATRLEPTPDGGFKPTEFDVFGPKAMACIRGLPVALASRCISVTMFRAGKKSAKPRRRIDAHEKGWTKLRDDLHALAQDYGADFLVLAKRPNVCPTMSGRDYELWQPLLALAQWVEEHGAGGLLQVMQAYAAGCIESGQDEQTPDCDEMLLRILAGKIQLGLSPIAKDLLEAAVQQEPRLFDSWSAKGVANALKRYGVETRKTIGRRAYGHIRMTDLRRIQSNYNMDLGFTDPAGNGTASPEDVPHVPLGDAR